MKKIYTIVLLGILTLVSCVDDEVYYPPVPPVYNNYLLVNGYELPVNAAEIEYLGRDEFNRDVFDLTVTQDRFLNILNTHTDQFILTRLHANQDYLTPEGYYNFTKFNNEIEYVDYAENVDIINGEFFADYYIGDFDRAELEVFYNGNREYTIVGNFRSLNGDQIQINYTGPIYDYTDNNIGYPLAQASARQKESIKERRKINLK
ncbi:hypothetical protein UJ101_01780 [Flavobacteriaceae bacterium UJ101]|nr:hypothetical protein UJ101_01780 [Flavobacteriaceae bacterium UJ101]